jgi:1,4-alpha-glucan branching enzyme
VAFAVVLFLYRTPGLKSGVDPNLESNIKKQVSYRFVIYRPDIRKAEIIGTFTDWRPIRMDRLSSSGYWAITLNLPEGEHRYSYLIGDGKQIADPTVMSREKDDFGGVNSIIEIKRVI